MADKMRATQAAQERPVKKPKEGVLTRPERKELVGESLCDERTVMKWETGGDVTDTIRRRLEKAARKLGIPIPEKRT
jgi:hypothetical protein